MFLKGFNPEIDTGLERKKNFDIVLHEVCERYPELSEKIIRSLDTPQIGKYHNEGFKMFSHLFLILNILRDVKDGIYHESLVDNGFKEMMRELVLKQESIFVDYTFLHDLAKPDCLTLRCDGIKEGVEITMEQWEVIERGGAPYRFEGNLIHSISYFHASEKENGQHGNKGAEMLSGVPVPSEIIIAIQKHEIAFQFDKISAEKYERHFVESGFSKKQQNFILIASYIDCMASLGIDGKPDMGNFFNLLQSYNNYLFLRSYQDKGCVFRDNDLRALKKKDKIFVPSDVERIIISR